MEETTIHIIRVDTVRETDCELLAKRMPKRFEKAMRFRLERDKLLCLGAGLLMMNVLGIRDESEICYGPHGKPFVPGMQAFSISHSGPHCILACGKAKHIGADIEEINERHIDIAERVYTEAELAWMAQDPLERFFQLWTWKESVMKATGMGMNLEPRSFEVLPFAYGKPVRVLGKDWYSWGGRLEQSRIGVCSDEPLGQVCLHEPKGSLPFGSFPLPSSRSDFKR